MHVALVEIRNLTKIYHREAQEVLVFQDLDLDINEGEFLSLMGPSGSGKSSLLHLLAGLDRPTKGTVAVGGAQISAMSQRELSDWRASKVGFIFQFYNLLPVLTAAQNVELPLMLTPLSAKDRRDRARFALEVVGLGDRTDHFPRQLSGGQEQRVAIARAVVSDPALILADEPTGDLDAKSADEVLTLLQRLNSEMGKTIVMVTHDAHAAERAHAVMHLDKGVLTR
ncbi:MAG: ABC transporter ATP-binding protein [Candidatus Eisenbacteria bacterium]|nr:ABC transporter ATP-binding protein [Candidatus Eisenbacteria bacterium]MCC7143459.1 ABC transporter ATP-binding protein [Candidatus Eisenbacteria bacterium]